jgi:hypothetical protein
VCSCAFTDSSGHWNEGWGCGGIAIVYFVNCVPVPVRLQTVMDTGMKARENGGIAIVQFMQLLTGRSKSKLATEYS